MTVGETGSRAGRSRTGIGISRDHRRKAYASEATGPLLTHMFAEQHFHGCEVEISHRDVVLPGIAAAEHRARHDPPSVSR
ncbi:hypothetical protein ACFVS9_18200 [Streptomyces sp. NPDC058008]|uniref:hypothetical protein n=1 Tax=Streptomyces sp. NPDC058008 TaxID=3346303 RepID=UPI0036E4D780